MRHSLRNAVLAGGSPGEPLRVVWLSDTHVDSLTDGDPEHPNATLGTPPSDNRYYSAAWRVNQVRSTINAEIAAGSGTYHAVVHTGDATNRSLQADWALFLNAWEAFNPALPRHLTLGNTDTSSVGDASVEYVTAALGYEGRTANAGSVFNHSFSLSGGDTTVRMLTLDTTLQESGARGAHEGYYTAAGIAWLEAELLACPESVAVIWSHHAPYSRFISEFSGADADALGAMLEGVHVQRPDLKVTWLYGHEHFKQAVTPKTLPGWMVPGYCSPALVQYPNGLFSVVNVYRDGSVRFENRALTTYPA